MSKGEWAYEAMQGIEPRTRYADDSAANIQVCTTAKWVDRH